MLHYVPVNGREDVFYRTRIEFGLESVVGTETLTVTTEGVEVDGESVIEDNRVVFHPSEPLVPSTHDACSLGEDEDHCFECLPSIEIIPFEWVCDAVDDCALGEDEAACFACAPDGLDPSGTAETARTSSAAASSVRTSGMAAAAFPRSGSATASSTALASKTSTAHRAARDRPSFAYHSRSHRIPFALLPDFAHG
jgi:hypothetical protein